MKSVDKETHTAPFFPHIGLIPVGRDNSERERERERESESSGRSKSINKSTADHTLRLELFLQHVVAVHVRRCDLDDNIRR